MKKTTIFILLLILIISICFAQNEKENNLKNYSNDLYSFKYDPAVWSFTSEEDETKTTTLKYKFIEQTLTLDSQTGFLFQASKVKNPLDISIIRKTVKDVVEQVWPNPEILSVKDVQNNGAAGIESIFISDALDKKYKVLQYIYRKDKNMYMITAVGMQNEFDKAKPLFDEVIKTYIVK